MSNIIRRAVVTGRAAQVATISRYLPSNYSAEVVGEDVYITGTDNAGWTLDGYVIPRLASGLFRAEEVAPPESLGATNFVQNIIDTDPERAAKLEEAFDGLRRGVSTPTIDRIREMLTRYVPEGSPNAEQFAFWLALCDRRCLRFVGVGIFDLEDWGWRDAFDEGASPREAVRAALENDDLYGSLFDEDGE